jgi:hypothetical protein
MTQKEALLFIDAFVKLRGLATDDMALQVPNLYPTWKAGINYKTDDRVLYNDVLYKVLTAHTSQATWTPDVSPSLFAVVLIPDEDVIPEWVQPDSTNPYMIGDKVAYNGKIYISIVDNNVWAPGVYGWEEYDIKL